MHLFILYSYLSVTISQPCTYGKEEEKIMVIENLRVNHISFGAGSVTEVNGRYFTVMFSGAKKTFVYPNAFEKFLTCEDGSVPSDILVDIEKAKEQKRKIEEAKKVENRHAMDHGIVIPGKEIVQETKDEDESPSAVEDI